MRAEELFDGVLAQFFRLRLYRPWLGTPTGAKVTQAWNGGKLNEARLAYSEGGATVCS